MEDIKKRKTSTTKIVNIISLSVFSFLLVCLITPFSISNAIGGFFRGLFGLSIYGIVIAGIVISALTLAGKRTFLQPKFMVTFGLLYVSLLLFVQLLSSNIYLQTADNYGQYLAWCYGFATYPSFGGAIGGLIVYPFFKVSYWLALVLFLAFVCVMIFLSACRINDIATGDYQYVPAIPKTSSPRTKVVEKDYSQDNDEYTDTQEEDILSRPQVVQKTPEQIQRDESLRILYDNVDFGNKNNYQEDISTPTTDYTQTRPDIPYVPVSQFDSIDDTPSIEQVSSMDNDVIDTAPPRPIAPPKTAYDGTRTVSSSIVRHITNTDVLDADEWSKRLRDDPKAEFPVDTKQDNQPTEEPFVAPSSVKPVEQPKPAKKVLFEEPEPTYPKAFSFTDDEQPSKLSQEKPNKSTSPSLPKVQPSFIDEADDDIDNQEDDNDFNLDFERDSTPNPFIKNVLSNTDKDDEQDDDYIKPRPPVQQKSSAKASPSKKPNNFSFDDFDNDEFVGDKDTDEDDDYFDSTEQPVSPVDLLSSKKTFSPNYNDDVNDLIKNNEVTDKAKAYIDSIIKEDGSTQPPKQEEEKDAIGIITKPVVLSGGKRAFQGAFDLDDTNKRKHAPTIHKYDKYMPPPVDLLKSIQINPAALTEDYEANARILEEMLAEFKVDAKVQHIVTGPTVTRYEMKMAPGIPIKRVSNIADDIAMRMSAVASIRIEAPIPGKDLFGVEIPNKKTAPVSLRNMIDSDEFDSAKGSLSFALGVDIGNDRVFADLAAFPHLLIAGSTGAGKSVCLNTMIVSLMYKYSPEDLKFLLVDPKQVEFFVYAKSPHLLIDGIITQPEQCIQALSWLIEEMERRYILLRDCSVKDINEYNKIIDTTVTQKMPRIVLIIDELNDLMTYNKLELENRIKSLSQKARAAGIHLVFATQRPSTDVLTGTIKANFPTRIALRVVSSYDAKTIMDTGGPDKLAGKGDMLFKSDNTPKPIRLQGAFVGNQEVDNVVQYIASKNEAFYDESATRKILTVKDNSAVEDDDDDTQDPLFIEALRYCVENNMASISSLQRRFNVGYNRAGRLITAFEIKGFVSAYNGSKSRTVIITKEEFDQLYPDE